MNNKKYKNKGIRCSVMHCDNFSQLDAIPYHRYPKDKEQLVQH